MTNRSVARGTGRRNKWATRIIVAGLSLLVLLAVLAYVTVILGHVHGEEIATETFQRRKFEYFQLPVIELQISGIVRTDSTGVLEDHLIKKKIISVAKVKTPPDESIRWDLVTANRLGKIFKRGEAEILCHYLDAVNADGDNLWVEWTDENPELAKVVWPAVVSVAQQELYIFVPELLELATNAKDPDTLKSQLDELLSDQYLRIAQTQQHLDRHELAVELFTRAIQRSPERNISALELRATSLAALGKQDKADADLAEVRELKRL